MSSKTPRTSCLRVAYVCADTGVPVFGRKGASIHVQELLRGLLRRGATVDLFSARADEEAPADLRAVRVHPLPGPTEGPAADREERAIEANAALLEALDRAGPFDFVYERYSLWSTAGMSFARRSEIPGLLEVNAPLIDEQDRYRTLVHRELAERVAAEIFAPPTRIVAVSRDVAAWVERWPGTGGRVHVVPNAADPQRFAAVQPRTPDGTTVLGFLGALKPWHGLDVLVDALALLRRRDLSWRMLVVGDGPERQRLRSRLEDAGLSASSTLVGAVDPIEIPTWLSRMDIGVAPYPDLPDFYFSPLKIFEYMAAGLPVVASRIGQLAEIIEHGRTGVLCTPGDPVALAAALASLRASPRAARALGEAARADVQRRFTWEAVVDRVLEVAALARLGSVV